MYSPSYSDIRLCVQARGTTAWSSVKQAAEWKVKVAHLRMCTCMLIGSSTGNENVTHRDWFLEVKSLNKKMYSQSIQVVSNGSTAVCECFVCLHAWQQSHGYLDSLGPAKIEWVLSVDRFIKV